jgi:hypothetical protein
VSDTSNDIDALLRYLSMFAKRYCRHVLPCDVAADYHAALTALVAERNALKQRVAELESHPPADRDRDLRERLVCAIWPQMLQSFDQLADDFGNRNTWRQAKEIARSEALKEADEMIAAMRKGDSDGK